MSSHLFAWPARSSHQLQRPFQVRACMSAAQVKRPRGLEQKVGDLGLEGAGSWKLEAWA